MSGVCFCSHHIACAIMNQCTKSKDAYTVKAPFHKAKDDTGLQSCTETQIAGQEKQQSVLPDEIVSDIFDVNTNNVSGIETEQSFIENEAKYHTIFNSAATGIVTTELGTNRILSANAAFQEMRGYTNDELTERTITDITHPDDIEHDLPEVRDVHEGRVDHFHIEKRYIRKNGTRTDTVWQRKINRFCDTASQFIAQGNRDRPIEVSHKPCRRLLTLQDDAAIVIFSPKSGKKVNQWQHTTKRT